MWRLQWFVVLAMSLIAVNAGADPPREWVKERVEVEFGGETYARWTAIETGSGPAYESRLLYEDGAGRRMVVRFAAQESDSGSISFRYLSTGEELTFLHRPDVLTVKLGIQQIEVTSAEIATRVPEAGTFWPLRRVAQGQMLIACASPGFREAIEYFSKLGCRGVPELHLFAFMTSLLTGIECTEFPESDHAKRSELVRDFDPTSMPPDEFEQRFDRAYFE